VNTDDSDDGADGVPPETLLWWLSSAREGPAEQPEGETTTALHLPTPLAAFSLQPSSRQRAQKLLN